MYCVFLVRDNGEKILLDFFKTESPARRYMDSFKHLKINGSLIMDFTSMDSIRDYINTNSVKGGKKNA